MAKCGYFNSILQIDIRISTGRMSSILRGVSPQTLENPDEVESRAQNPNSDWTKWNRQDLLSRPQRGKCPFSSQPHSGPVYLYCCTLVGWYFSAIFIFQIEWNDSTVLCSISLFIMQKAMKICYCVPKIISTSSIK